jgi:hypothetical protein
LPRSPILTKDLLHRTRLEQIVGFANAYTTFWVCSLAALCLGILLVLMVQCCPQFMNIMAIIMGVLTLVALAIGLWKQPMSFFLDIPQLRIGIVVAVVLAAFTLFLSLILYRNYMRISGIFLSHAARFIKNRPGVVMHIPMMLILTGALLCLTIF